MKTLIIPDVHEDIPTVERILEQAGPVDHVVWLGDWYDSFQRSPATLRMTTSFLKCRLENFTDTFLWGNHDLPYAFPDCFGLKCSGHSVGTRDYLAYELGNYDISKTPLWERFVLTTEVEGWRLSHAGFGPGMAYGDLDKRCEESLATLKREPARLPADGLMSPGQARGGNLKVGGCTWLDWDDEFEPIRGLKQIVGHSKDAKPRYKGSNLCLDTKLKHFAIIDSGRLVAYKTLDT